MATRSGSYQNRARIEWVYTVSPVSQSTTQVTVTVAAYLRMQANTSVNGNWPVNWWGSWGTSNNTQSISLSGGQRQQIRSWSQTVTLTDSVQSRSVGIRVAHFHGATEDTLNISIPARYARTPTSLTVERTSDSRVIVRWTRQGTYTSVPIQFRHNVTGSWGPWTGAGTASGNAASFIKNSGLYADRAYQFRVQGRNAGGASAFTGPSAVIYMTPGTPSSVSATRVAAGIRVAIGSMPTHATHFDVWDEATGSIVGSNIPRGSFPWVHASPDPAVPHRYRARARQNSGGVNATLLVSAYSAYSNTVQLQAPPNAPTNLSPNAGVVAAGDTARYSWRHNPVDSSEQTISNLRYRPVGGEWTSRWGESNEFYDLALDTPGSYEWQVRTQGAHASYGPWSATATVTVISVPTVAISTPDGGEWTEPTLTAAWTYGQDEGRPQTSWRVQLTDVDADDVLVDETGTGAASSYRLPVRLVRATRYRIRVWVGNSGIWSDFDELSFETVFVPPASPVVDAVWNEETGSHDLTVWAGDEPGLETTVRVVIDRSIDGGETWEPVTESPYVEGELSLSDYEGLSHGTTLYRVTGYSVADEAAEVAVPVDARSAAIWLGAGAGFGQQARLPSKSERSISRGRMRAAHYYEGRSLPVAYVSQQVQRRVEWSGIVTDQPVPDWSGLGEFVAAASRSELEEVALAVEPVHLYRDSDGNRVFGVLGNLDTGWLLRRRDPQGGSAWSYALTMEEVEQP